MALAVELVEQYTDEVDLTSDQVMGREGRMISPALDRAREHDREQGYTQVVPQGNSGKFSQVETWGYEFAQKILRNDAFEDRLRFVGDGLHDLVGSVLFNNPYRPNGHLQFADEEILENTPVPLDERTLNSLVSHIQSPEDQEIAKRTLKSAMKSMALDVAREVREPFPAGTVFLDCAYAPSPGQERRIQSVLDSKKIAYYLLEHRYLGFEKSVKGIAREVTHDRDFAVSLDWIDGDPQFHEVISYLLKIFKHNPREMTPEIATDEHWVIHFLNNWKLSEHAGRPQTIRRSKIDFETMQNLAVAWSEMGNHLIAERDMLTIEGVERFLEIVNFVAPRLRKTEMGQILQYLVDLWPYRTYQLSEWEVSMGEVAKENQRAVGIPKKITDFMGLYPDENVPSKYSWEVQQTIVDYRNLALSKGGLFGHKAMLDWGSLTRDEKDMVVKFYTYMLNGWIHAGVVEYKNILTHGELGLDEMREMVYDRLPEYEEQWAFTVFGMFHQMLASIRESNIPGAKDFFDALARMSNRPKNHEIWEAEARKIQKAFAPFFEPFLEMLGNSSIIVYWWPLKELAWIDDIGEVPQSTLIPDYDSGAYEGVRFDVRPWEKIHHDRIGDAERMQQLILRSENTWLISNDSLQKFFKILSYLARIKRQADEALEMAAWVEANIPTVED